MSVLSAAISIVYLTLSLYYMYVNLQSGYLVVIKNGPIIGEELTTVGENKTYYSFRGIPYAKPPIGDLRFSAPVPPDNWMSPRKTTQEGSECFQSANSGSEDCLYINVYSPTSNSSEKLPVMVWVYGGYFLTGDSDYNSFGPDYLLEQNVIVVAFNYRLGVFGYLSTEDEEALGNWGIKDQILALQWVQDNIAVFGGDKNSITLFGQSAGAAAVSYLSQIAETKGLIHKVIIHSGSSINIWALSRHARDVAFLTGSALGINASDSKTLIEELRKVDSLTLNLKSLEADLFSTVTDNPRNGLIFAPVIESESNTSVITWKSHEKLSKGDFHHVPFIAGFNTKEAGSATELIKALRLFLVGYDLDPTKLIPIDMNLDESNVLIKSIVTLDIKTRYFGLMPAALSDEEIIQFIDDDQFVRPIYEIARIMSKYTPVYLYRFSFVGEQEKAKRGNDTMTFHGDELFWIWKLPNRSQDLSERDLQMRHKMLTLWTNFAKYGDPTPSIDTTLDSVTWNQVNSEDVCYLDIGEQLKMGNEWSNYSIDFWQSLYNTYGNPPYDTY